MKAIIDYAHSNFVRSEGAYGTLTVQVDSAGRLFFINNSAGRVIADVTIHEDKKIVEISTRLWSDHGYKVRVKK